MHIYRVSLNFLIQINGSCNLKEESQKSFQKLGIDIRDGLLPSFLMLLLGLKIKAPLILLFGHNCEFLHIYSASQNRCR